MTKIFLVLFVLLVSSYLNTGKAQKSEEITVNTGNTKSDHDDDDSASIQVVQRDTVTDKVDEPLINNHNPHEEENYTEALIDTNITKDEAKYDTFFEGLHSDSSSGDIILEHRDDNIEEVSIPGVSSIENLENNKYSNRHEKIDIVFEDITKSYSHEENSQEDSTMVDKNENNWRSAENFHSDNKKDVKLAENEESSVADEEDDTDYMDKKIDLDVKGRMELRRPERREHFNTWPINERNYGPLEDHGILDSGPMRSFSEILAPRYRPVLTRTGIVYTPALLSMHTGSPLLDRLSARNWFPNRAHITPETDAISSHDVKPRLNIIGVPQYEDSKMLDDYNDYGSNTNTYSYAPLRKVTTQAPPQQIVAPNKFDVFQKLVEASNHLKSQKKTLNEFLGNYHPQRQHPESYGSFGVRRVR